MKRKLLAASAAVAALAIAGCGSDSDDSASSGPEPAGNGADRAFVADMIPHHQSAVDMAKIAEKRGQSPFVKRLAADIIRTQNEEITVMRSEDGELADAGIEKGDLGVGHSMMGMENDAAALEDANPFDRAFIDMMIPHHEGAVTMAEAELAKGKDPELRRLAEDMIEAQQREIADMRREQ